MAVGTLLLLLAAAVADHWIVGLGAAARLLMLAVVVIWNGYCGWRWVMPSLVRRINPLYAADAIERQEPSLKNSLINYLLVREHPEETAVVRDALERQAAYDLAAVPVDTAVDRTHVLRLGYALVAVVLAFAVYKVASPKDPFRTVARVLAPLADIARPSRVTIREVTPGDAEIFAGLDLTVSAVIEGLRSSEEATLLYSTADGQVVEAPVALQRQDDRRHWRAAVPPDTQGAQQDFRYRLRAGDAITEEFQVRVSPAPSVIVRSVHYEYPAYTRRAAETVEDRGDLSALEGTRVTLRAEANQPIQSAWIEFDPPVGGGTPGAAKTEAAGALKRLPLKAEDRMASGSFRLEWDAKAGAPRHRSYRVRFITPQGHRNERPIVHAIEVQRDLPPEIEILDPQQSRIEVPEDGQREIVVRAIDPDFGVSQILLRAVAGGTDLKVPALLSDPAGRTGQIVVKHNFQPRDHGLKAGDQVVYWARVEDNRATPGKPTPEPNSARTQNQQIVITRAEKSASAESSDEASESGEKQAPGGAEKSDSGDSQKTEAGGNEGQGDEGSEGGEKKNEPGEKGSGESDGQQGGMGQGQSDQGEAGQSKQPGQGAGGSGTSGQSASGSPQNNSSAQGSQGSADESNPPPENGSAQGNSSAGESSSARPAGDATKNNGQGKPSSPGGSPNPSDPASGPGADSQPLSSDGTQDREVFERLQEYLKEQQQSGSGQSAGATGQQNPNPNGSSNSPTPANQPPQDQAGSARPSQTPQPGEPPQNAGRRDQPGAAQRPDQKQGDAEGRNAGSGQGGSPQGPAETRKEKADPNQQSDNQQPIPGQGDSGNSGAGVRPENPRGSPQSQEQNRDRQKDGQGSDEKQSDDGASSPSSSKRQSDSQGSEGGDQSGGGKQGGGQGAKQPGNDSPGSSSAADEGAGAAAEPGAGETSNQPGHQKLADRATGNPSQNTPGQGSGVQPNPQGGSPQSLPSQQPSQPGEASPMPQNAGSPPSPDSSQPGSRQGAGQHTFGAQPQGGIPDQVPQPNQEPPPPAPENAQVNLEYARKATDLALETLRDQKNHPDAKLLEKLGWTAEELQRFLARWEAMKQAAAQEGRAGDEARQTLNETLESLGLRPTNSRTRRGDTASDAQRGLRDSGHRTAPPREYQKQYEAYLKGAGRTSSQTPPKK
jgi:hypothetical protein